MLSVVGWVYRTAVTLSGVPIVPIAAAMVTVGETLVDWPPPALRRVGMLFQNPVVKMPLHPFHCEECGFQVPVDRCSLCQDQRERHRDD